MFLSKTPLRVSLFGGGSDFPEYFRDSPGAVLGSTINRYIYTAVLPISDIAEQKYRISYRTVENTSDVDSISHPIIREILRYKNVNVGLNISTISDLPGGSGLGSSSAFTVGFLNVINRFLKIESSPFELFSEAVHIERDILKENVGIQDQLHASNGGLKMYKFEGDNYESHSFLRKKEMINYWNKSLTLVFTDTFRNSSKLLTEQISRNSSGLNDHYLNEMVDITLEAQKIFDDQIISPTSCVAEIGKLLNESWELKKKLGSQISNPVIESMIEIGKKSGVLGAKLLGAGAGGFILFLTDETSKKKLMESFLPANVFSVQFCEDKSKVYEF